MDWIKIKTQHLLFGPLNPTEKGVLVMAQCLAATLERMPTEDEIAALPGVGRKVIGALSEKLRNVNATLSEVLRKVIEDVSKVHRKRLGTSERMTSLRSKSENVTRHIGVTSHTDVDKIRLDKSILKEKYKKEKYSDHVEITPDQYVALVDRFGQEFAKKCIERLDAAIPNQTRKPYRDHYRAILSWVVPAVQEDLRRAGLPISPLDALNQKSKMTLNAASSFLAKEPQNDS